MHINKPTLLEEAVDAVSGRRADAERRGKQIRARAQMRNRAQILDGVALFLKRIIRRGSAFERNFRSVQLKRLARLRRQKQRTLNAQGRADVIFRHFLEIIDLVRLKDDLQAAKAAAVV